jgi:hypothetical protein
MAKQTKAPAGNRGSNLTPPSKTSVPPAGPAVNLKRVAPMDPSAMSASRRSQVASMPGTLPPTVDVIDELKTNRLCFTTPEGESPAWLSIGSFLNVLSAALDKLRTRSEIIPVPGRSTTAACCIFHGLEAIEQHPHVQALRSVREDIARTDFEHSMVEDLITSWLNGFDKSVALPSGGSRRLNIALPTDLKSQLHRAADSMGVHEGLLAVLCVAVVVAAQRDIHEDHRATALQLVNAFLLRVQWQAEGARALLEQLTGRGLGN